MTRPVGEIRRAICTTLREQGAMPLCDLVRATQVGYRAARWSVQHALRSGGLAIVGHEKRAHCKKWVALYDVVEEAMDLPAQPVAAGTSRLANALSAWR